MTTMTENVRAAVQGALAGWALGAQCRGRKGFRRLNFYDPIPPRMVASHALESWLVWSAHLRDGRSSASQDTALAANWSYPIDETVFGLGNVNRGLASPVSGAFNNPLCEGSEAIGRAVYWGLAFHGFPDAAAERAYHDASIDHDREGTWVAVAIARTVALLQPDKSATEVVRDLMNSLPRGSRLLGAIPQVLKGVGEPDGARIARETIPELLKIADPFHAVLTGSWIVLGLAHGRGAFEESVLHTAGCGGAAAHASLACGAITGFLKGAVPMAWTKPLGNDYVCGHGLRGIAPPKTIEAFVKTIVDDYTKFANVPEEPEPVAVTETETTEPAPVAVVTPVVTSPPMSAHMTALLTKKQDTAVVENGCLHVSVQYVEAPVVYPGVSMKLSIGFTNVGQDELRLTPQVATPNGWEIAHKLNEFVLAPGTTSSFALVLKTKDEPAAIEHVTVTTTEGEARFPLFASQLWYWVGPMTNQEGTGFDKEYPAEKNIKLGQVFNGRSNMPVEWRAVRLPGERIDVEQMFGTGPGVVYLYCEAQMPSAGAYKIVAASGVGVVCWIDGVKKFWYHSTHTPVPRAAEPYLGSFTTDGSVKVLIKTFRNLEPVPPMSVYFLAEDGTLAVPVAFEPLP
jgi:hypothetical protein